MLFVACLYIAKLVIAKFAAKNDYTGSHDLSDDKKVDFGFIDEEQRQPVVMKVVDVVDYTENDGQTVTKVVIKQKVGINPTVGVILICVACIYLIGISIQIFNSRRARRQA